MALNFATMKSALSTGLALFTAVIASHYFTAPQSLWILLTTFFVSLTTTGTPLRQAIHFLFIILLAMIAATLLTEYGVISWLGRLLSNALVAVLFITSAYYAVKNYFLLMLFSWILLIAFLSPFSMSSLPDNFIAILIGALIGIVFKLFIFPVKLDDAFCRGVVPVLKALENNATSIQVEKAFASQQSSYPNWVYETGFNPGLRASWRFMLIHIERLSELYFSLNYLLSQNTMKLQAVPLAMQKNAELLAILIHYFETKQYQKTESDYTSDITELEIELKQHVPAHLDLIDMMPEYLTLTAVVRDIKDIRNVLLQLVLALPS